MDFQKYVKTLIAGCPFSFVPTTISFLSSYMDIYAGDPETVFTLIEKELHEVDKEYVKVRGEFSNLYNGYQPTTHLTEVQRRLDKVQHRLNRFLLMQKIIGYIRYLVPLRTRLGEMQVAISKVQADYLAKEIIVEVVSLTTQVFALFEEIKCLIEVLNDPEVRKDEPTIPIADVVHLKQELHFLPMKEKIMSYMDSIKKANNPNLIDRASSIVTVYDRWCPKDPKDWDASHPIRAGFTLLNPVTSE